MTTSAAGWRTSRPRTANGSPVARKVDYGELRPIPVWWIVLYCFGALWLFVVASLDASHFGPGFIPLMISVLLVPLLAIVFVLDLFVRIVEAIIGKRSSPARRLVPVLVSLTGTVVYGRLYIVYLMAQT